MKTQAEIITEILSHAVQARHAASAIEAAMKKAAPSDRSVPPVEIFVSILKTNGNVIHDLFYQLLKEKIYAPVDVE